MKHQCPVCKAVVEIGLATTVISTSVETLKLGDMPGGRWEKAKKRKIRKPTGPRSIYQHRMDMGIALLRTPGEEHNWIPRTKGGEKALMAKLPKIEPKPIERPPPRAEQALAEQAARLENRAVKGKGKQRPFKDVTPRS